MCWESDGSGGYTIEKADGQRRGTKIVIQLKDEFEEFAKEDQDQRYCKEVLRLCAVPGFRKWGKGQHCGCHLVSAQNQRLKTKSTKNFTSFRPMTTKPTHASCTLVLMLPWK